MSSATTPETYNGSKNYPTWAVNLWLSNDESLYREALERTRRWRDSHPSRVTVSDDQYMVTGIGEPSRAALADTFKAWVRDELAPDLGASFAADLLGYALDSVDWYEIADAWIEQVNES